MKAFSGFVKDLTFRHGVPSVTVEAFPASDALAFSIGQPVTIVDRTPEQLMDLKDLTPTLQPLTAAGLTPAHLGSRVRVKVLGGAVIEDQLEGVETQWNGGKTLIFLSFKTATFAYAERARAGFPALPDTEVTIVEEPTK